MLTNVFFPAFDFLVPIYSPVRVNMVGSLDASGINDS